LENKDTINDLQQSFGTPADRQETADQIATAWVPAGSLHNVLKHLKLEIDKPYKMLYDLTAIDERRRNNRPDQPQSDFLSFTLSIRSIAMSLSGSRPPYPAILSKSILLAACLKMQTGTSVKSGTCSASVLTATPIFAAY
jgi:NADH:ubiquinone oxidoreductase subunit C